MKKSLFDIDTTAIKQSLHSLRMLLHNVNIKQRVALKYYTMQLNATSALDYYEYCDPKSAEQESGGKIITNKG